MLYTDITNATITAIQKVLASEHMSEQCNFIVAMDDDGEARLYLSKASWEVLSALIERGYTLTLEKGRIRVDKARSDWGANLDV